MKSSVNRYSKGACIMIKSSTGLAAILVFFLIAVFSHADMTLQPTGIKFPDNSTQTTAAVGSVSPPLNLTGAFTTGSNSDNTSGAVISAVNSFSGSHHSYGGYFEAQGVSGMGVYTKSQGDFGYGAYAKTTGISATALHGISTGSGSIGSVGISDGHLGKGVYGSASGTDGKGVSGWASNTGDIINYGGYFQASGRSARGIFAKADNANGVVNYGGYFEAAGSGGQGVYATVSGITAKAVYGEATNSGDDVHYGGYFQAAGDYGRGVYGTAPGINGRGVYGYASGTSGQGVRGSGGQYDFYAAGGKTNFGPFTGAHEVRFSKTIPEEILPGMIVSATGRTEKRTGENGEVSLSSTLPTVALSSKPRDKAVFGVIVSSGPLGEGHWHESGEGERFGVANALGEGRVWVTDINGTIEAGDYVTTSSLPGYGQLQGDDLLHSYTLGKSIESVDFDLNGEEILVNGTTCRAYLLAVVYTSG